MRTGLMALLAANLWGCAKQPLPPPPPPPAPSAVEVLSRLLPGTFDSVAQAAANPSYYGVRLEICPISVPELGASVYYVEQALLKRLEAPYRQRLYVLQAGDPAATRATIRVFELAAPAAAIGLCSKQQPLQLAVQDVVEAAGCAVLIRLEGDRLVGGTEGKLCPSDLSGASYTTSDLTVTSGAIEAWDRGYAADGAQVWGVEMGPYSFERSSPISP